MSYSKELEDLFHQGIEEGVFPGAVALVWEKGDIIFYKAVGNRAIKPNIKPMRKDTLFDLASLTKPIVTATLIMQLVEKNELGLEKYVKGILEDFDQSGITVKHLLTHTSGLPAWSPFYLEVKKPNCVLSYLGGIPLEYQTGSQVVYSCLGYILLGKLVERVTGKKLDVLAREQIFHPLEMYDTFYNPSSKYTERCAATEGSSSFQKRMTEMGGKVGVLRSKRATDNYERHDWREGVIVGQVHDENAHWLGGVAGNAGLFSTADDLGKFCNALLENGNGILSRKSVELIRQNHTLGLDGSRGLGWIITSDGSLYHTGFTGTSIRINLDRKIFAILLTNRIHPDADNAGIIEFRERFYGQIFK